ncbi:MAG: hypothetical protein FVQ81_15850 [Candidatus Glassbacteria bacterium]|nr:hypothetical protein [Candidatus Glassbacteria bacterium]
MFPLLRMLFAAVLALMVTAGCTAGPRDPVRPGATRAISRDHPRLLGSAERLKQLAREKPETYARVVRAARELEPNRETVIDEHMKMVSMALVYVIDGDRELGRQAVERALKYVDAPIRVGHQTFAHDLARCAIVYDLCWPERTAEERRRFQTYLNETVDANVRSEASPFHNGWYGYKHWGIGLACYATWYENPRAEEILAETERDYAQRAAPALELSGAGGGFAEGYYVNYWLYEWLFFCEVARIVEGRDHYAAAPGFYRNRAVAGMFEAYPWKSTNDSRRPVPIGDSGGQQLRRERDKALNARRILVNFYRNDPAHQAVHAFNESTPRASVPGNAYKDFLWRDTSVPQGDLDGFKLSHFSPAAGYVFARSDWSDEATHFYFKCGDRFTSHQHLDNGHFLISRHNELAGDGGQYYYFGGDHDVNYLLRTVAHSTVLVYDPDETWPDIRAHVQQFGGEVANDGGQHHDWPHHNGASADPQEWNRNEKLYDIADMLAFRDEGEFVYAAGDISRSYKADKLETFTRQIVYIRPGTFVIFDRVTSTKAEFVKTWQLQAAKPALRQGEFLVVTNDDGGRLFVQTLLPEKPNVRLHTGDELYSYHGKSFPPEEIRGPAPECRIAISPSSPAQRDLFLHVLTVTDSDVNAVPAATVAAEDGELTVILDEIKLGFSEDKVDGWIEIGGARRPLGDTSEN